MYKHILLPTDGSELSAQAVREGIRFAKSIGARVTALHVTPVFYPMGLNAGAFGAQAAEHAARSKESTRQALEVVERAGREAGVPCAAVQRESDTPWDEIIKTATADRS